MNGSGRPAQRYREKVRIGVTGHTNLSAETTTLVRDALRAALRRRGDRPIVGLTCLAPGADRIFAELVLEAGGRLEVVLPAADYREATACGVEVARFDDLVSRADKVRVMPFDVSGRPAFEAANQFMLDSCDAILAVWDGHRVTDRGGTGSVVHEATHRGIPVEVVWPEGASRLTV